MMYNITSKFLSTSLQPRVYDYDPWALGTAIHYLSGYLVVLLCGITYGLVNS